MGQYVSAKGGALLVVMLIALLAGGCNNAKRNEGNPLESADLHYKAGWEFMSQGEYRRARAEFEKAVAIYPKLAEYYNALGLSHFFLGNHEIAIQRYHEALQIAPGLPDYQNNLANAYLQNENYEKAIEWAQSAKDLPNYRTPERALFVMGLAYAGMNQRDAAKQHYLESIEQNPEYVNPYITLAEMYVEENQCVKALEYVRTARTLTAEDGDPGALMVFAKVQLCIGRYYEAIDALLAVKQFAAGTPLADEAQALIDRHSDKLQRRN